MMPLDVLHGGLASGGELDAIQGAEHRADDEGAAVGVHNLKAAYPTVGSAFDFDRVEAFLRPVPAIGCGRKLDGEILDTAVLQRGCVALEHGPPFGAHIRTQGTVQREGLAVDLHDGEHLGERVGFIQL